MENAKEEQPVESKRTRVHELLGVEVDEVFTSGRFHPNYKFRVTADGTVEHMLPGNRYWSNGEGHLKVFLNEPDRVERRPTLTDEQREVLVWLHKFEFGYVAADEDGEVCAYRYEPEMESDQWVLTDDGDPSFASSAFVCLRPLIPDWTKPLDIEKTLRDAGCLDKGVGV